MDARTSRRQKRISKRQEEKAAADLGGRTQANSGATRLGGGGDVRVLGQTRVECKYTENCSYTLKLSELLKLRKQAQKALEEPVFQIQYRGASGAVYFTYAVVPPSGARGINHTTTNKQMNFHETDMNLFFSENKVMRINFIEKTTQKRHTFDIMKWADYLESREAT